jgi:hypothetical protein
VRRTNDELARVTLIPTSGSYRESIEAAHMTGLGPVIDLRMLSPSPAFARRRIPTWPHIPRKFTRPSHLGFAIAPNRSFSRPGGTARVGSIPIARSTSRIDQDP